MRRAIFVIVLGTLLTLATIGFGGGVASAGVGNQEVSEGIKTALFKFTTQQDKSTTLKNDTAVTAVSVGEFRGVPPNPIAPPPTD
jgi:hypothetical protein